MNAHIVARSRVLLACVSMTLAGVARGEQAAAGSDLADLSIEQLMEVRVESVYGASRYRQKVTQAPSSVSIVTAEEIGRYGYRSLVEVLRGVRGLFVSDDRNYTYLGIRGFLRPGDYNTRVLVTIDGHRINDSVFDSGTIGREGMVDVALIDRVEIIRGPSSSVYGSSAFFGVINVVTKRGAQFDAVEVSGEGGSLDTRSGRLTYGSRFASGAQFVASASHYESGGVESLYFPEFDPAVSDDARAANGGRAVGLDEERAANLFTSLQWRDLSFSGFYSRRYKQVPLASFGTIFNDPGEETWDYRGYVDLQYVHSFGDALDLQGRVFYDVYDYHGNYPYDYAMPGDPTERVLLRDGAMGRWVGGEWQATMHPSDRHKLMFGGEYRYNVREFQYSYDDLEPRFYYLDDDRSSSTLGLFAQDEFRIRDDLTMSAGLRMDRYSEGSGSTVNPRVALIYNPTRTATLKALYGEAFRAPNPYERYYNTAQASQPMLDPETVRTYELVYEQYLGSRYAFNVSAYHYEVAGLISQAATDEGEPYFDNLDSARANGLELELEGKYPSGAHVRASYALQRAEDGAGSELSSSPQGLGKLNVSVPVFAGRLFAGLELQYQSASRTIVGGRVPGFCVANLTLFSRQLLRGLELSGGVFNAFDRKYGYAGAEDHAQRVLEQDGRTFRGSFTYRF